MSTPPDRSSPRRSHEASPRSPRSAQLPLGDRKNSLKPSELSFPKRPKSEHPPDSTNGRRVASDGSNASNGQNGRRVASDGSDISNGQNGRRVLSGSSNTSSGPPASASQHHSPRSESKSSASKSPRATPNTVRSPREETNSISGAVQTSYQTSPRSKHAHGSQYAEGAALPETAIQTASMSKVWAGKFKRTMQSSLYIIYYQIGSPKIQTSPGSQESVAPTNKEKFKGMVLDAFSKPEYSITTDFVKNVFLLSQNPKSGPGSGPTKSGLTLTRSEPIQWEKIVRFLRARESFDGKPEEKVIIKILKAFLTVWCPLESGTTLVRSLPIMTIHSRHRDNRTSANGHGNTRLADVIGRYLKDSPADLRGLEVYLKGLQVLICPTQDGAPKSDSSTPKTICGLARRSDDCGLKRLSPPKANTFGGCSNTVRFYLRPKPSKGNDGQRASDDFEVRYPTVANYFKQKYQKVESSKLPVLNVGTRAKPTYVPPTFCVLVPESKDSASTLTVGDLADIVGTAKLSTCVKNSAGKDDIRYLGLKLPLSDSPNSCHVSMTAHDSLVTCRTKQDPSIAYNKGEAIKIISGKWDTHDIKLSDGKNSLQVASMEIGSSQWSKSEKVVNMPEALYNSFKSHGIVIDKGSPVVNDVPMKDSDFAKATQTQLRDQLLVALNKGAKATVLILPNDIQQPLYDYIKRKCDIEYGIHNVCAIAPRIGKEKDGYLFHLALKLNLKTGGSNQALTLTRKAPDLKHTMIVGIDVVCPPKKAAAGADTILAAVFSSDSTLAQWPAAFQAVGDNKFGSVLVGLLKGRAKLWRNKAKDQSLENVIIYYNGSMDKSYLEELPKLRDACGGKVKITLIEVHKEHRATIRPASSTASTEEGHVGATAATIIRPMETDKTWEFSLQGRNPRKVSKTLPESGPHLTPHPIRYSVIHDEIFTERSDRNVLEDLTHDMCYLSACSTSVMPNTLPIHYVGLLCDRIRSYVRAWYHPAKAQKLIGKTELEMRGDPKEEKLAYPMTQERINVHKNLRDTMFYI